MISPGLKRTGSACAEDFLNYKKKNAAKSRKPANENRQPDLKKRFMPWRLNRVLKNKNQAVRQGAR